MSEYLYEDYIRIPNIRTYRIFITHEHQIILELATPNIDDFGEDLPTTMYVESDNKISGMLVYRMAARKILTYLYSHNISYFWFSTGYEKKRDNLYLAFAVALEKHGYICSYSNETEFHFVKKN